MEILNPSEDCKHCLGRGVRRTIHPDHFDMRIMTPCPCMGVVVREEEAGKMRMKVVLMDVDEKEEGTEE